MRRAFHGRVANWGVKLQSQKGAGKERKPRGARSSTRRRAVRRWVAGGLVLAALIAAGFLAAHR